VDSEGRETGPRFNRAQRKPPDHVRDFRSEVNLVDLDVIRFLIACEEPRWNCVIAPAVYGNGCIGSESKASERAPLQSAIVLADLSHRQIV